MLFSKSSFFFFFLFGGMYFSIWKTKVQIIIENSENKLNMRCMLNVNFENYESKFLHLCLGNFHI